MRPWIVLVLAVVSGVVMRWYVGMDDVDGGISRSSAVRDRNAVIRKLKIDKLTVETMEMGDGFVQRLVDKGKPVIVTGTNVSEWKTLKKWNSNYMVREARKNGVEKLDGVRVGDEPVFAYHNPRRPMNGHVKWDRPFSLESMGVEEYFQRQDASNGQFVYYSVEFKDLLGGALKGDVSRSDFQQFLVPASKESVEGFGLEFDPAEGLEQDEILHDGKGKGQWHELHCWMGSKGVIAHTHYDPFHNFFVQTTGRKKFLLFAPDQWPGMHMFPKLHPGYRQSQLLDLDAEINPFQFPFAKRLKMYEVDVVPGDVLYLPPYWFHRVIAVEPSISLNIWSLSDAYKLLDRTRIFPLPFEGDWSEEQKIVGTWMFVKVVVEGTERKNRGWFDRNAATFVRHLVDQRYLPIFGKCGRGKRNVKLGLKRFRDQLLADEHFMARGRQLSQIFSKLDTGVQGIALSDWIEEVVMWSVGGKVEGVHWALCWMGRQK